MRDELREHYRTQGMEDGAIDAALAGLDERELKADLDEVKAKRARQPKLEGPPGEEPAPEPAPGGAAAAPEPAEPAAAPAEPEQPAAPVEPARAAEDDTLRRYGFMSEDIAAMSPAQRAAALQEAAEAGVTPEAAQPEPPAEGTRAAPVEVKTPEDLAKAEEVINQDHTPAQGEANNVQRGHIEWPPESKALGITLEAPKGGVRRGVAPDGTRSRRRLVRPTATSRVFRRAPTASTPTFLWARPPTPRTPSSSTRRTRRPASSGRPRAL
jgi:hypothetical protein